MKRTLLLTMLLLLMLSSFAVAATTLSEPSYCCERTSEGAYCVNADQSQCDGSFKKSPTSCETTSYCRSGTCYDSDEGICLENTPQSVCEENSGTWDERDISQVPQCGLGCCVIADQAAFVTLTRCKRLATFYGVENNFDTSIDSELSCIATAQSQDVGACVYEKDFERICEFTTRADCGADEGVLTSGEESVSEKRTFYKDMLCSAEELNTACARQTKTQCYQGQVYWTDSCGNLENVYSANRDQSWNDGRVAEPNEVCSPNDGSNPNCGNCDYFAGTRCAEWESVLGVGKPEGSDYFCRRTDCVDRDGNNRLNGESWCVYDSDIGEANDLVGSRHYREVCVDGDVRVEPCDYFRNGVCVEGSITTEGGYDYGTSACRANRWQECIFQVEEEDCTNGEKRDCIWLPNVTGLVLSGGQDGEGSVNVGFSNPATGNAPFENPTTNPEVTAPITGNAIEGAGGETRTVTNREDGVCVPKYTPGFDFWQNEEAGGACGLATAECAVVYEETLLGDSKIISGEECLEEAWAEQANRICTALGDCGGSINYIGEYTDDGYQWFQQGYDDDDGKREFSPSAVNRIKGGISGLVIAELENSR